MSQAVANDTTTNPPIEPGHRGSASFNLSGRAVLTAWIVSIAAHALLLFTMLLLVFPYVSGEREADPVATRVSVVGPLDATGFMPSLSLEWSTSSPQREPLEKPLTPKEFTELSELTTMKKPELSIIGIGAGGGDFSKYGLTVGGGPGPDFFGLGSTARGARKIIYVVDRSGSMIDTFIYVQAELKRSISALRRSQKFHVIFFNTGEPLENPPKRLVSAIDAQKESFFEFLDRVIPSGGTKPAAALRRALANDPDLIYLLSDGIDFHPTLLTRLDQWNKARRVRIYTIAYLDQTGSELLELIAREHNGEYLFVSEDDLP